MDIEPNIPLLRKTFEYIKDNPEEWNQASWISQTSCGTAYCFAGTTLMLSGYKTLHNRRYTMGHPTINTTVDIEDAAIHILGLNEIDAKRLFSPVNNLDDISRILSMITDGEVS